MRMVLVSGPRQCGKTTIMRKLLKSAAASVSMDKVSEQQTAASDPAGYLNDLRRRSQSITIDEFQRVPSLVGELKYLADEDPTPGHIILSASINYLLQPSVNESLAGRIGEVRLRTLTQAEICGKTPSFLDQVTSADFGGDLSVNECSKPTVLEKALVGGYPAVQGMASSLRKRWFSHYLKKRVAPDLAEVSGARRDDLVEKVIGRLGSMSGRNMNISDLAREFREDRRRVKACVQGLKALYLMDEVPSWTKKVFDRATTASNWYVTDTGLMSHVLGYTDYEKMREKTTKSGKDASVHIGNLVETFVYTQLVAEVERQQDWKLYHLRLAQRQEIDFLLENDQGDFIAIEVKASETFHPDDAKNIIWFMEKMPQRTVHGIVLYCGQRVRWLGQGVYAVPIAKLWL
ncbi:MAG: AAA family ATPase [Sutterellaceae bacterium]|nr:AAA family ATPase [Sutterellaceae bacterium]